MPSIACRRGSSGFSVCIRVRIAVLAIASSIGIMAPANLVAAAPDGDSAFTVLYTFGSGPKHRSPQAGLIQASDGYFYGTTLWGAVRVGGWSEPSTGDVGTVFRMDGTGDLRVRHVFDQGGYPTTNVIQARDGAFYGTKPGGFAFKMDASGSLAVLHFFTDPEGYPPSSLIQAGDGNFYGTTTFTLVSQWGRGVIFRMDSSGAVTILHPFYDFGEGAFPAAGLLQANDGNFYGTTSGGGSPVGLPRNQLPFGTVFKMDASGAFVVLHSFTGSDGSNPRAALIQGTDGHLYGTASEGGANDLGAIFRIDTDGTFTLMHSFSGADGANPQAALLEASGGGFYGTTATGGANGLGTVFTMDSAGNVAVVHSFTGPDGVTPLGSLIEPSGGCLYGTTSAAGRSISHPPQGTFPQGTIFRLILASTGGNPAPLPANSLSGKVTQQDGVTPIPCASVYSYPDQPGGTAKTAVADAGGTYVITGLVAGSYRVQAKAAAFDTLWYPGSNVQELATSVTVANGESTVGVDVALPPRGITPIINPPEPRTDVVVSLAEFMAPGVSTLEAFKRAFMACNQRRAAKLLIPPGRYVFDDPAVQNDQWSHLTLSGFSDLTIEGYGAELVFHFLWPGIQVISSERLVFRGLSIDYDFRLASPGIVQTSTGGIKTIRVPDEYPVDRATPVLAVSRFNITAGTWVKSSIEAYPQQPPSLVSAQTFGSPEFNVFSDGDEVILRHYGFDKHAFNVGDGSSDIAFEDVTIYGAPGMGFYVGGADRGLRFSRTRIMRKPDEPRVISTAADGIHITHTLGDILIEDSDFSSQGDDSLNINGSWGTLVTAPSGNTVVVDKFAPIYPGSEVKFVRPGNLAEYARALVVSSSQDASGNYTATLDQTLPGTAAAGDLVANVTFSNPRFLVRNNFFHDHRARGMLIQSPNGLVENNTISDMTMAAIHLTTSDTFFKESLGVENVIVRGNILSGCAYGDGEIYASGRHMGCLSLIADVPSGISAYPVHRNVVIEDNTIIDMPGLAILVGSSDGVIVRNNTIVRSNQIPFSLYHTGEDIDAKAQGSIMVTRASNVTVTGNLQILSDDMFDHGIYVDPRNTSNILVQDNSESWVFNGGFEIDDDADKIPDGWKRVSSGDDRIVCNSPKTHTGNCAFRFKGDIVPETDSLKQVILHAGAAGDTLDLRVFARASNLGDGQAKLVVQIQNSGSGQLEQTALRIPAGTYPYQELSLAHTVGSLNPAIGAYDRIVLKIKAAGMPSGSLLFLDDVRLGIGAP